ncbi:low choriolytic enzyme-like [Sander lucioperca]|uniref:low choriolytic enzyme-like n=1 Tax=Sander lucioperca TaxID=283035 RepID=UPI00125DC150|nr:low choriolytic enzyme-like [Sander lucioperca]
MMLQAAVLSVLVFSVHSFTIQASFEKREENSNNTIEDDNFSVSTLLEKANVNLGKNLDDPLVLFGDIAVPTDLQNADPCTARGCLWPKATDGNVYVPYRISNQYSTRERETIVQSLRSFAQSTCIRFTPLANGQRDFVDIQSREGCFSYIGRRGRGQVLSLMRRGCVFLEVIQHELLHALGFHHEQNRSDRDQHVRILLQNVKRGLESQFTKVQTRNLGTPYDYGSVMQYDRFAFSRNRQPTIVPIPDNNVDIGRATRMSPTDILRVNRLYECNSIASRRHLKPGQRKHFL